MGDAQGARQPLASLVHPVEAAGGPDTCPLGLPLGCAPSRARVCRVTVRFLMWASGPFGKTLVDVKYPFSPLLWEQTLVLAGKLLFLSPYFLVWSSN